VRIGLVVYGSMESTSGGYLYDRIFIRGLPEKGDSVEVVSIPAQSYSANLTDNLKSSLVSRISRLSLDILFEQAVLPQQRSARQPSCLPARA
jgi:hypothetical protein